MSSGKGTSCKAYVTLYVFLFSVKKNTWSEVSLVSTVNEKPSLARINMGSPHQYYEHKVWEAPTFSTH
ncbi:hypothetical protein HanHA300_Chr15g0585591 [Helianthus annuus]|nr:hypothetical protein HanHA300_Chr15g0585591 [Helianthus annuus]KAJ0474935.1 hypothetical protein HanHA89_Chr15g0635391 [Helianthus annuus]KAJ0650490.1 hypothetical protein HanLR1_Chr15g0596311 [Helianthus annuus]